MVRPNEKAEILESRVESREGTGLYFSSIGESQKNIRNLVSHGNELSRG